MLNTTLTALAAAAALHTQVVAATTPADTNAVSSPAVTAISAPAPTKTRREVRIPGTFDQNDVYNPADSVAVFLVARSGDGA